MQQFKSKNLSTVVCNLCGASYLVETYRLKRTKYCSFSCKQSAATISRNLKSRGTGKAYVKEGGRHQHRVVVEQVIGRKLLPGEIVHHKNGNKKDNRPENLQVMTQSEHAKIHSESGEFRRPKTTTICTIHGCGRNESAKGLCKNHYLQTWKAKRNATKTVSNQVR